MNIVLDTNIWLSGTFWEGEAYKFIKEIEKRKIKIIITKKILLELTDVLNKEAKFQKFIKNRKLAIESLLRTIISISSLVASKSNLKIIKEHPSDDKILESAIDGRADYIISYDNHLLKLKEFKNIKILTPAEFLKKQINPKQN